LGVFGGWWGVGLPWRALGQPLCKKKHAISLSKGWAARDCQTVGLKTELREKGGGDR